PDGPRGLAGRQRAGVLVRRNEDPHERSPPSPRPPRSCTRGSQTRSATITLVVPRAWLGSPVEPPLHDRGGRAVEPPLHDRGGRAVEPPLHDRGGGRGQRPGAPHTGNQRARSG